jgi:hypothetical protein
MNNTLDNAKKLIQDMAENAQQFGPKISAYKYEVFLL